jgi:hypothetical protein
MEQSSAASEAVADLNNARSELDSLEQFSRTAAAATLQTLLNSGQALMDRMRARYAEMEAAVQRAERAVGDAGLALDDLLVLTATLPADLAQAQERAIAEVDRVGNASWQASAALSAGESAFAAIQLRWDAAPAVDCTLIWRTAETCMLEDGSRAVRCGETGVRQRWQEVVSPANSKGRCAPQQATVPCSGPPCPVDCRVLESETTAGVASAPCLDAAGQPSGCSQAGTRTAAPVISPALHGGKECTAAQLAARTASCTGPCEGAYQDVLVRASVTAAAASKVSVRRAVVRKTLQLRGTVPKAPRRAPVASWEPAPKDYVDKSLHGFPVGCIVPYAGTAAVPANWAVCDGTRGTPNLVGRFVKGASASEAPGSVGGAATRTLGQEHLASHNHDDLGEFTDDWTTSEAPDHTHEIEGTVHASQVALSSVPGTDTIMAYWSQPQFEFATERRLESLLSMYEDGFMRYRTASQNPDTRGPGLASLPATPTAEQVNNPQLAAHSLRRLSTAERARKTIHAGNHSHTVDLAHTHTAAEAGEGKAFSIEPPHYTLVFIMRVS